MYDVCVVYYILGQACVVRSSIISFNSSSLKVSTSNTLSLLSVISMRLFSATDPGLIATPKIIILMQNLRALSPAFSASLYTAIDLAYTPDTGIIFL